MIVTARAIRCKEKYHLKGNLIKRYPTAVIISSTVKYFDDIETGEKLTGKFLSVSFTVNCTLSIRLINAITVNIYDIQKFAFLSLISINQTIENTTKAIAKIL
jgi:hypothetical protein